MCFLPPSLSILCALNEYVIRCIFRLQKYYFIFWIEILGDAIIIYYNTLNIMYYNTNYFPRYNFSFDISDIVTLSQKKCLLHREKLKATISIIKALI